MTEQFDRTVITQIGEPGAGGREFRDLRQKFRIKHTLSSGPNEAKIELWNPAPETIALAQTETAVVRVFAGYDTPALIFQGEPNDGGVEVIDDGVETTLKIDALEGAQPLASTRVNVSFGDTVTAEEVLETVADELGLPEGVVDVPEGFTLEQGGTFVGRASDVLDRIAVSIGADISIQAGSLQVIPEDGDTGVQSASFSSENDNLLDFREKDDGFVIKALLNGSVRPGDRVEVTRPVDGDTQTAVYKARDVEFRGGNGDVPDFDVVIVAREAT